MSNIEIINIKLNTNIEEEIRKKTDTLNEEIKIHTKGLIKKAKLKKQKTMGKKKKVDLLWRSKLKALTERLEAAYNDGSIWVSGRELENIVDIDSTSLQSIVQRLRTFLKKSKNWKLTRKKGSKPPLYRLERLE